MKYEGYVPPCFIQWSYWTAKDLRPARRIAITTGLFGQIGDAKAKKVDTHVGMGFPIARIRRSEIERKLRE